MVPWDIHPLMLRYPRVGGAQAARRGWGFCDRPAHDVAEYEV